MTLLARQRDDELQLSSFEVSIDVSEVAALEAAVPVSEVAGTRYAETHMAMLDSAR